MLSVVLVQVKLAFEVLFQHHRWHYASQEAVRAGEGLLTGVDDSSYGVYLLLRLLCGFCSDFFHFWVFAEWILLFLTCHSLSSY